MLLVYPKRMAVGLRSQPKRVYFCRVTFDYSGSCFVSACFDAYFYTLQEIERRRALLRSKVVQQREEEVRSEQRAEGGRGKDRTAGRGRKR